MVMMDQFTHRIVGFAVQPGVVDGPALCRLFNQVIGGAPTLPQAPSTAGPTVETNVLRGSVCPAVPRCNLDPSALSCLPLIGTER